jgi:hypothetical protein
MTKGLADENDESSEDDTDGDAVLHGGRDCHTAHRVWITIAMKLKATTP